VSGLLKRALAATVAVSAGTWAAGMGFVLTRQDWPAPRAADAVVVLGTSATVRGHPSPCMRVRVAEGVRLVDQGVAPFLIVSGGLDPRDGIVEAEAMRDLAEELGLAPDRILMEDRATSTIENLEYSVRLLASRGLAGRIVVTTEPFHLPRAMWAARRLGIDADGAPSGRCPGRGPGWMLREPAAVVWYWWKLGR
jgi:uncharacterized SAM-binding protein YcdF (DUF218 family)